MAEFIVNPRRAPRAPARCRAEVASPRGDFVAETEDIGSFGCQLVSPVLVRKGDPLRLVVSNDRVLEPAELAGRVAWVSLRPPWRVGVAFGEASLAASARWLGRLLAAYPGLGGHRRVPDRIRTDATIYLAPPPRFLLDFTSDEALVLRAIASGARVYELMAKLRDRWPGAQRALFSLLARQALTLQRGQAVHPHSWKKILTDIEASLAVESLGAEPGEAGAGTTRRAPAGSPAPVSSARAAAPGPSVAAPARGAAAARARQAGWSGPAPHDPTRMVDLDDAGPPLEIGVAAGGPGPTAPARDERTLAGPRRDFEGAGVGWRARRGRSPDAQAAYERALAEVAASNVNGALSFLRLALSLAPGDAEIAQQLGKLAFKGRTPGR